MDVGLTFGWRGGGRGRGEGSLFFVIGINGRGKGDGTARRRFEKNSLACFSPKRG